AIGISGATSDVFGMGAYKLSAQFGGSLPSPTPSPSPSPSPSPLLPDAYEVNNSPATASNLGKLSSFHLTALTLNSSQNVDYYKFSATVSGTFKLSSSFTQAGATGGSLSLSLLNSAQAPLAASQAQLGSEVLSVTLTSGQTYYIMVASPSASLFT